MEGSLEKEQNSNGLARRIEGRRQAKDEHFVVMDENCATHLVRNALGVGDEELICGIVGAAPSISRNVRVGIMVQVIFFDDKET